MLYYFNPGLLNGNMISGRINEFPKSPPSRLRICKWLVSSYLIALLILSLIYMVLAIWNGIFHADILLSICIGFPASIFMDIVNFTGLHLNSIGRYPRVITLGVVGYAAYIFTGTMCVILRNTARFWKIFLWIFFVLLLLNFMSCVPKVIMFGIGKIE
jgi:hypothetical protein